MVTVVLPTANRPQMLRTALQSILSQSAKEKIGCVIVSENGGAGREDGSSEVCTGFPALPIRYVYRDPPMDAKAHGAALYLEASELAAPYVAVLHDDDWWASDHLANALRHLQTNQDAVAYWSTNFAVEDEASWYSSISTITCWMAAGFPPLHEVAKLDCRQAALACLGGAPAHYSTLVAEKRALADAFLAVAETGNSLDNDRLLFVELAKRGTILASFVPEVFVRRHVAQAHRAFSPATYRGQLAATTRAIMDFSAREGIDIIAEFARRYEECPNPAIRSELVSSIMPGVLEELRRYNPQAIAYLLRRHHSAKWFAQQVCPPFIYKLAIYIKAMIARDNCAAERRSEARPLNPGTEVA